MGAGHCPWYGFTDEIVCNIGQLAAAGEVNNGGLTQTLNHRPLLWIVWMQKIYAWL